MFFKYFKKWALVFFCLSFIFLFGQDALANIEEKIEAIDYPRLANYYLPWSLNASQAQNLARWDFLILDMENQHNNLAYLELIKEKNPQVIILAYVPAQELYSQVNPQTARLRTEIIQSCQEDWYLHNQDQERVSFWPGTYTLNITQQELWPEKLVQMVENKILQQNIWDGVFYDNLTANISWLDSQIDLNSDGRSESSWQIDQAWKQGALEILKNTQAIEKDFILVGNSASDTDLHPYLNGRMFETFPTPWEGNGQWADSMRLYLRTLPEKNLQPNIYIINSNTENSGVMDNYRQMRFGLTSTLLGDGFFSFDYGDQAHSQLWWYDEYDVLLGQPQGSAYNLLNKNNFFIQAGLWRRDFERGIALVNSTNQEQTYIFNKENFEKIEGQQDRRVNNGVKINWIKLAPQDGVVLLKIKTEIIDQSFVNGNFVRVFNAQGEQERNGFFSYEDAYSGQAQILKTDLDQDGQKETLVSQAGQIKIYHAGKERFNFYPYTENFKHQVNLAVADINNDGQMEIITGAGAGGGPHVRVFTAQGELINQFFAYHQKFFGGVNLAVADINNDGQMEIITGAGAGGGPHVRVFNNQGQLINQFFAYASDFYGGISVSVGDINNDGQKEIITSPGKGGQTKVRIFTQYGQLLKEFFAYDSKPDIKIQVLVNDLDEDGEVEILTSSASF